MTSRRILFLWIAGKLAFQIFAQQAHQEIHFGLRAAPVFQREGVEREAGDVSGARRFR